MTRRFIVGTNILQRELDIGAKFFSRLGAKLPPIVPGSVGKGHAAGWSAIQCGHIWAAAFAVHQFGTANHYWQSVIEKDKWPNFYCHEMEAIYVAEVLDPARLAKLENDTETAEVFGEDSWLVAYNRWEQLMIAFFKEHFGDAGDDVRNLRKKAASPVGA